MQEPPVREDGLQLEEHGGFQSVFWQIERSVWVLFIVILLLALAGLTGAGGYFSRHAIALAGGELQTFRITRWGAADELRVRFDAGPAAHRLILGPGFFDYFEVEAVQPEPERSVAAASGSTMTFAASDRAPASAILHVRPLRPGLARFPVELNSSKANVTVLILP